MKNQKTNYLKYATEMIKNIMCEISIIGILMMLITSTSAFFTTHSLPLILFGMIVFISYFILLRTRHPVIE